MGAGLSELCFARLTEIIERPCKGTCGFCFEKPPSLEFRPGQFANFLIAPAITDPCGGTRTLSIASAPHDADLMIPTRMRDTGFKRALSALPIGSDVGIQGPFGDFTLLHGTKQPAVFLAGGSGLHHSGACFGTRFKRTASKGFSLLFRSRLGGRGILGGAARVPDEHIRVEEFAGY